ncbi:MAG: hypothetical protein K8R23_15000 [Chthoniobacter sp.]|nr:hypothetical protein [Chthoniobacter sp.]
MKAPHILAKVAVAAALSLTPLSALAGNGQWTLIGWNNLGMHCMDDDYSVFTILPPFNTVNAQLINAQGKLVLAPTGLTLTYEPVADLDGSINRTSAGKTNFWEYLQAAYGATLPMDAGLAGTAMPGSAGTPQPLTWNAGFNWFEGVGIPISPIDDAGRANAYPMMRLVAKNNTGAVLAKTDVVLPVSGEMDCRACHGSGAGAEARPAGGWVNDPVAKRDYRLNILRLHDEKHLGDSAYQAALAANGFRADGLLKTVTLANTPILCAKCHASEALGTAGAPGVDPLTRSMHAKHANVTNPANGLKMDNIANRSACYQCHPGSATRCLRGAMGAAVAPDGSMAMQCQSCHGTMSQVGALNRTGWLDEPGCQTCHTGSATQNNGLIRYTSSFDTNGQLRQAVSALFATNPDTPAPGKSLYRFSKGHGGLQCEACHGSTHAEFPSAHRNDNVQSAQLQGHAGVLMECTACHATMPAATVANANKGPHGMHPIGDSWAKNHPDIAESVGVAQCRACHGTDDRGTVLSRVSADRTVTTEKFGAKAFWRGQEISCYECHSGSNSSNPATRTRPAVAHASLTVPAGGTAAVTLSASGTGSTVRIIRQPNHGSVALSGRVATYFAESGYVGPDNFAYAASDSGGYVDSATTGTVSVTVGTLTASLDSDGDGIPDLIEYALGLNPQFPSASGVTMPTIQPFGGVRYLTMSLARFLPPSDATLSIEVSGNLQTWLPATVVTSTSSLLQARDPVPADGAAGRFIRLKVTRP